MKIVGACLPPLRLLFCSALLAGGPAAASETDALLLADQVQDAARPATDRRWFVETALGQAQQRPGDTTVFARRLSLGFDLDKTLAPDWRAVLSGRYDLSRPEIGRAHV